VGEGGKAQDRPDNEGEPRKNLPREKTGYLTTKKKNDKAGKQKKQLYTNFRGKQRWPEEEQTSSVRPGLMVVGKTRGTVPIEDGRLDTLPHNSQTSRKKLQKEKGMGHGTAKPQHSSSAGGGHP